MKSNIKPGSGRWALGTMSGTSFDGIDLALLKSDGREYLAYGPTRFCAYDKRERSLLQDAQERITSLSTDDLRQFQRWPPWLKALHFWIAEKHAQVSAGFLQDISDEAPELVGFHGQTLAHRPQEKLTLQIGCSQTLANALDLQIIYDFRQADIKEGGQGAPLAPFFHWALAKSWEQKNAQIGILNIGGVSNLTLIDTNSSSPDAAGALLAFDCGPGNAPLDDLVTRKTNKPFDVDGIISARGQIDQARVDSFLQHKYFDQPPPKSLDRNSFTYDWLAKMNVEDGAATLVEIIARSVALSLEKSGGLPSKIFVCGGGRRNPTIIRSLASILTSVEIIDIDEMASDGDMIEAQAFAYLAIRVQQKLAISAPSTTGCRQPAQDGKITMPQKGSSFIERRSSWPKL